MSFIMALPAQRLVINAWAVIVGQAPSHAHFAAHVDFINAHGEAAYINFANSVVRDIPVATLASNLLTNLGLTQAFTQAEAVAFLNANANNMGGAMVIAANWTLNYVSNPAAANNAQMLAARDALQGNFNGALNHSINPASLSATPLVGVVTAGGTTYTLTSGIDVRTGTAGNDIFDGSVNAQGTVTLTSVDVLDGAGGNDTLIAQLAGGNIAARLSNIENAELITAAATTFDLINTTGLNNLVMRNSNAVLTVNNIASTKDITFSVQDQAADFNLNFTNAALTGVNAFTLNLSGAQSDAGGGAVVDIAQQAGANASGLETLTLASGGAGANFLQQVTVENAAGASTLATLNVTGAQSLTVATDFAASVRTVDASGMTGAVGLSAGFDATAAVTVTGSGGSDTLTFADNNADSSIAAGAGNDVITLANFTTADTVAGGEGTADRLSIAADKAEAITAALVNTTGFEQLSLNTAGSAGASINATRFGAIDTVRLDAGTAGAYGVTMAAGSMTLGLGGTLGGILTVTDTGTATTDALTLANRAVTGVVNMFNGQAITINGYETVNLNTGAVATAAQTTGVITLNNDSLTAANTLNIAGANKVTVDRVDSNSSGLLTIDASGLTGAAALTMTNAPTYTVATGTVRVVGSANADTLLGSTAASGSTIIGGAGHDTITGGSKADSISGDAGNDDITGAGGNDTITGGDGSDTITLAAGVVSVDGGAGDDTVNMAGTLSAGDTVSGGDGTDMLQIAVAATAATATGVTGFERLSLDADAALTQGMEQFTANPGFTRIHYNTANNSAITVNNAATAVDTIQVRGTTGAFSFARLVDTAVNALTIVPLAGAQTVATLTTNDEETVTINTGAAAANDLTITNWNASDLTTLHLSGAGDVIISTAIAGAANLATISATGLTGALTVHASASTANITATGAFGASNTITGGTGADTITGGTAGDSLSGGAGADIIDGGVGADTLLGGLGADSITGGIGDDTITGGVGNDTLVGGDGADDFRFEATAAANGVDTITGFVSGTDDLDVTTNALIGAVVPGQTITVAAAQQSLVSTLALDNSVHFISMNGAAANLTTGGTATLSTADMTATTLTALAAYLTERFGGAGATTVGNDSVVVINWTAAGSTTSFVYEFVNADTGVVIDAAELTLIGVVDRGTTVLAAGDVI